MLDNEEIGKFKLEKTCNFGEFFAPKCYRLFNIPDYNKKSY